MWVSGCELCPSCAVSCLACSCTWLMYTTASPGVRVPLASPHYLPHSSERLRGKPQLCIVPTTPHQGLHRDCSSKYGQAVSPVIPCPLWFGVSLSWQRLRGVTCAFGQIPPPSVCAVAQGAGMDTSPQLAVREMEVWGPLGGEVRGSKVACQPVPEAAPRGPASV